jgi:hypothetical protein
LSQRSRNQFPNPAAVNGRPCAVSRNVREPHGLEAMISVSTGKNGFWDTSLALVEGLFWNVANPAITDMLPAECHHVLPAGASEQQQRQRQPSLGAERIMLEELLQVSVSGDRRRCERFPERHPNIMHGESWGFLFIEQAI